MSAPLNHGRLMIVSNRLPFVLQQGADGTWQFTPGAGGLVTALLPILRARGGVWVGWPGGSAEQSSLDTAIENNKQQASYELQPVHLDPDEVDKFYNGFSNEIVWPLFHDLQSLCIFDPAYWHVYRRVNQRYAQTIAQTRRPDDLIWVHDYHLMHVAHELRALGVENRMAFFLHIPFPPLDIFAKLPWRDSVLRALLCYDLVGFQTARDRRNFTHCVRALTPDVAVERHGALATARTSERSVRISSFPISIDYREFAALAASQAVADKAAELRTALHQRQLILGIDRLDYTKGIPQRFEAFRNALRRYPDLRGRITLIQVVVPSRENIPRYNELKGQIERMVGEINGEYTRPGEWVPIHYVFRSLNRIELAAYYRAAEIALVTPLKDGMNLVAKEYCACSVDEDCVLILSEFAGAATKMRHDAMLVNPNDVDGVADAIHAAFVLPPDERIRRMHRLRRYIKTHDVYHWVDSFLGAMTQTESSNRTTVPRVSTVL